MKVLGIVGSPRKGANTDILITKALEGAWSFGATTKKVYLCELGIRPCQGCGRCIDGGGCIQMDPMQGLYKEMDEADGLILGSPVYMNNVSAQMKLFIDRCNALMEIKEGKDKPPKVRSRLAPKKRAILVCVCGSPLEESAMDAMAHLRELCYWLKIDVLGEIIGYGLTNPGDIENRKDLLDRAFFFGSKLVRI